MKLSQLFQMFLWLQDAGNGVVVGPVYVEFPLVGMLVTLAVPAVVVKGSVVPGCVLLVLTVEEVAVIIPLVIAVDTD